MDSPETNYRDTEGHHLKRLAEEVAEQGRQHAAERRKRARKRIGWVLFTLLCLVGLGLGMRHDARLAQPGGPPCGWTHTHLLPANPRPTWDKDSVSNGLNRFGIWDGRICTFSYPSRPVFCFMECGPRQEGQALTHPTEGFLEHITPPMDGGL